jgi:hypothetical protein
LWLGFLLVSGWWGPELEVFLGAGTLSFLPFRLCAELIAGGMAVGSAGGLVAARHAS